MTVNFSLSGSSVHGILQARIQEWVTIPCSTGSSQPRDCSLPGPSVHGILQARILEWVAVPSSRGSSQPKDQTHVSCVSCLAGRLFTTEPPGNPLFIIQFSSVTQSCPTLCDPMNRSTPGLPVDHQLPEFTQTHVHRVSGFLINHGAYNWCFVY